jgi:hypothetical protein
MHRRLVGGQWFLPLDRKEGTCRGESCHGGRAGLLSSTYCEPLATGRINISEVPRFSKFSGKAQNQLIPGRNIHMPPLLNIFYLLPAARNDCHSLLPAAEN